MARVAARTRTADLVLPAVNALVRLTIGGTPDPDDQPVAANVPSRIEDLQPADPKVKGGRTQLFVAVPHYPGDVNVPRPGTACTVTWVSNDGLYDLPTAFVERVVVGPVVWAWRVEVTGTARRAQRRRYVRVPWSEPVRVDLIPVARIRPPAAGPAEPPAAEQADDAASGAASGQSDAAEQVGGTGTGDTGTGDTAEPEEAAGEEPAPRPEHDDGDDERETVHGTTLDLSEGGIRCALPSPPLRSGQPVRVHLDVQDEQLVLDGTVVRVKVVTPRPGARPVCETGIAFTEPDKYGDLLRKVVFNEQLRSRRSGLE